MDFNLTSTYKENRNSTVNGDRSYRKYKKKQGWVLTPADII